MKLLEEIVDLVYPRFCVQCGERVGAEPLRVLCPACLARLAWQQEPELPVGSGLDWILSLGSYEEKMQDHVHEFKFRGQRGLGRDLARGLLRREGLKARLDQTDALIPVPLHPLRQKERGFNQAAVMAGEIREATGVAVWKHVLRKDSLVQDQVRLSRKERWENTRDAFACNPDPRLREARVALLDDVATTGATLHACARLLREAGAALVGAIVLARTRHP